MSESLALIKSESAIGKTFLDYILKENIHLTCKLNHMKIPSCRARTWGKLISVLKSLIKINIPIHVIPLLLFRVKTLKSQ